MTRRSQLRRRRSRAVVAAFAAATLAGALGVACGSKTSAVAAGGECFLATDCASGLICIEQSDKRRVCSDDLSRVAGRPPPDGGGMGDADAESEGGDQEGGVTPPPDSSVPDTGTVDTGTTPEDTGAPPVDSGGD